MRLLNARNRNPDATSFDQIIDFYGTILVFPHHWGDHDHPSLSNPEEGKPGKGLLLWFVVDDFDTAWERAQAIDSVIQERPNANNGTGMRAFTLRDPDGYYVAVNEQRHQSVRCASDCMLCRRDGRVR